MRFLVLMLAGLVGCDATATDTSGAGSFSAHGALAEAVPTVLVVEFTAPEGAGPVVVEWGPTAQYGHSTPIGEGTAGRGAVVGLHPDTVYHWRAVVEIDGERIEGADQTVTTGSASQFLGALTLDAPGDPTFGHVLTSTLGHDATAVIYDEEGVPVWWMIAEEGAVFTEVRLNPDGSGVLLQRMDGYRKSDIGAVLAYAWDGTLQSETRTPGAHHDFVVREDGSYGYCATDTRMTDVDGVQTSVVGEALREVAPGGAEADIRTVWTSWDTLPVRVDPDTDQGFYPEGLDWVHCNGLAYDADTYRYTMSAYALRSVLAIDGATGELVWVFGGEDNQFSPAEVATFREAHSPEPLADGMRLFINRTGDAKISRVARYRLDADALTVEELPGITLEGSLYSPILGDSNALPDGHVLVSWGFAGTLTEVDEAGELVWKGSASLGTIMGFAEVVAEPGGPF